MSLSTYNTREEVIRLRKFGLSFQEIKDKLNIQIPKSTMSGWLKNVLLTKKQRMRLNNLRFKNLVKARIKAKFWHNTQKSERLLKAKTEALKVINNLDTKNHDILKLALAMLYLGEGFKKNEETGIGNTNPLILKVFLKIIRNIYGVDISKIRCELHLRSDQDSNKLKKFWAKELGLSVNNFKYVYFDKRTNGVKSFPDYKGVCMLRCANVAIQRNLLNISNEFCNRIIK